MKARHFIVPFVVLTVALLISACGTPAAPISANANSPTADPQIGGGAPGQSIIQNPTADPNAGGGVPGQAAVQAQPLAAEQNTAAAQVEAAVPQAKAGATQAATVEGAIPPVPAPGQYPNSPEGVVQAFLASYAAQPNEMSNYLSQSEAAAAPADGAASLLGFNSAALEGFVIDAAAVNPNPPAAVVSAAVKVGGAEIRRTFTLGKEGDQWKIETIDQQAQ